MIFQQNKVGQSIDRNILDSVISPLKFVRKDSKVDNIN